MLQLRFSPDDVHEQLATSDAVTRLVSGDALDQAMFGSPLLAAVLGEARSAGATAVELQVTDAGALHDQLAADNGLVLSREIHRMGRALPVGEPFDLAVRPFRVGVDEAAWLELNNRAFAWHPDQGGWEMPRIQAREAEPWFDPAGFLLHERDGRLAAFCWTKEHHDDEQPPVGEIFVIGVDPAFHGSGIGRPMVLAGLDHLARRGLDRAILYVEAGNTFAVALYERLGFAIVGTDRWWRRDLVT